jgi:hypothetical protein
LRSGTSIQRNRIGKARDEGGRGSYLEAMSVANMQAAFRLNKEMEEMEEEKSGDGM